MIEEKIEHLTPEQRHEVEDFIDFLITRDSGSTSSQADCDGNSDFPILQAVKVPARPVMYAEERPVSGRSEEEILPDYPEYGASITAAKTREPERRVVVPRKVEKEPNRLLDWID